MANYLDMNGFPESGQPLLESVKGVVNIKALNQTQATGWLYHTTGTGALTINNTLVTSMNSGDGVTTYSPSTGTVYSYFQASTAASYLNGYFVPYTGATSDVNLGAYLLKSTNASSGNYDYMYPNSNSFTTNYYPIDAGSAYGTYSNGSGSYNDPYGDNYLYDSSYSNQIATIDYTTGYIDTSSFSGDTIYDINYYYTVVGSESYISYNGSKFSNGIIMASGGITDSSSIASVDTNSRALYDASGNQSMAWVTGGIHTSSIYSDSSGTGAVYVGGAVLQDNSGNFYMSVDSNNRGLYGADGTTLALNWSTPDLIYGGGSPSGILDLTTGTLKSYITSSSVLALDFYNRQLYDSSGTLFVSWANDFCVGDGGTTNYTQFDETGHQTMVGTAQPWDDLRVEPIVKQAAGVGVPAFEKYFDDSAGTSKGVYLYSFTDESVAGNEKEIFFTAQMPHSWNGGEIKVHVHFVPSATVNSSDIRWGLEYAMKEPMETFGDTTIIYSSTTLVPDDANITAGKHYIATFSGITPDTTQDDISTILICRLFRNSSNGADTYTNKVGLLYVDIHFQMARLGSNDEYTA